MASTFQGSNGQSPEAGANVEPGPGAQVQHVRFGGCAFMRNAGNGLYIHSGEGGSVLGATVVDSLIEDNAQGIIVADTDDVTISRNRVTGHDGPAQSGIVVGDGTGVVISDNDLDGNHRGILSAASTAVEIRGNTVVGTGPPSPGAGEGAGEDGDGIVCRGIGAPVADACIVDGNFVRRSLGSGILTLLASGVRVRNNIVDQAGQGGIHFRYTSASEAQGNRIAGIGQEAPRRYHAILLTQFSDANLVTHNVIRLGTTAQGAVGVSANSRGNQVHSNVVLP
jgi:parallel beta-helix repeat protein